jgi:hypothetical protein
MSTFFSGPREPMQDQERTLGFARITEHPDKYTKVHAKSHG